MSRSAKVWAMFTIEQWRRDMHGVIADIAASPQAALVRAEAPSLHALLLGSTMVPIVRAYAGAPGGVMVALIGLSGGFGVNLIANLMQRKYTPDTVLAVATAEAQSYDLGAAYQKMASGLHVFELAEAALQQAGHAALWSQLRSTLYPGLPKPDQLLARAVGSAD